MLVTLYLLGDHAMNSSCMSSRAYACSSWDSSTATCSSWLKFGCYMIIQGGRHGQRLGRIWRFFLACSCVESRRAQSTCNILEEVCVSDDWSFTTMFSTSGGDLGRLRSWWCSLSSVSFPTLRMLGLALTGVYLPMVTR
jgi:hypothetical protein